MTELVGKQYYRTIFEFVNAAELPEDAQFMNVLFLKGDFVIKFPDGSQMPMKRDKFLSDFQLISEAQIINDSIEQTKRIVKSKKTKINNDIAKV